jgi:L-asparaginase
MASLHIITTGGTFDKEYDMINGKLFFQKTHVEEMLRKGRSTIDYTISSLMMIDSLDMEDSHRISIAQKCSTVDEDRILITHGTDTMTQTAAHLASLKMNKTIVLTGALIPYTFGSSDGMFNLGSALAYTLTLSKGVYIVMNGYARSWDNVQKNKSTGFFESLS